MDDKGGSLALGKVGSLALGKVGSLALGKVGSLAVGKLARPSLVHEEETRSGTQQRR